MSPRLQNRHCRSANTEKICVGLKYLKFHWKALRDPNPVDAALHTGKPFDYSATIIG